MRNPGRRAGEVTGDQVFATVPVLQAVPTGVIAYRVWERYEFAMQFDDYLPLLPRVRRHLRVLAEAKRVERVAGPENRWKRRGHSL